MHLRGTVTEVGAVKTVSTQHGERDLCEIRLADADRGETRVTLWGKWTETAAVLDPGMELSVRNAAEREWDGEVSYETTGDSTVVVEPGFLVDVTDLRSWVQCPRLYYLNKVQGLPLAYPVTKGTIVHEVFGDLLRGMDLESAVDTRVDEAGLELGLLGKNREDVADEVRANALAIQGWLEQDQLSGEDAWRSEVTLLSERYGIKGRCDAIRRGRPVELKTGKNTGRSPRFHDKIQAAAYALLLQERGVEPTSGTLLYTQNGALDRSEETGDLSPAKEFTIGQGLLDFVVRTRNELAAMEYDASVPTGYEADATCEYCFEQDTCLVVSGRLDQESKAGQVGEPIPERERMYFEELYGAVEDERRAIHREYRKLFTQSPDERAAADRAMIGLEPADRERLPDGRWRLVADRPGSATSKIREGDRVLASDGDPVNGHSEYARVETLDPGRVVVTADEPVSVGRLDVYPSELSADRMLTALHDALLKGDERRKAILFGEEEPRFDSPGASSDSDATHGGEGVFVEDNPAQNRAIQRALEAEDFALVHGPPGTGKTYTIATLVEALVERGDRVLLAAFTNRAVDNALESLRNHDFEDVVRVGTETGVRADMQDIRLDRDGDPAERAAALEGVPVVAATTATCASRVMRSQTFDTVVVDEASQLTEPDTYAAINRGDRFVLVGDHQQLPPVVRDAPRLETSLFERLVAEHPDAAVLLDRQYRMRQRIQAFPSREFYDGKLRPASAAIASQSLGDLGVDASGQNVFDGVAFVDVPGPERSPSQKGESTVAGDDSPAQANGAGTAHANREEAQRIGAIVDAYREAGLDPDDMGVIAPFRAQVAAIGQAVPADVAVDTVDRFQGSSSEVIVVSFVATGSLDGPIFEDHRRLNVALTRAKRSLVLVGDAAALASEPRYERMLEWAGWDGS